LSRLNAANNAQTLLVGAITDTDTVMTVLDGSIFPEPPFLVTVEDEIIEVGARSGNVFSSLLRGQEGTAAASHAAESLVENRMTAGMYSNLVSQDEIGDDLVTQTEFNAHKADNATGPTPPHGMGLAAAQAYEVGTWTPILGAADGLFNSVTYNSATYGTYTRIGDMCFCQGLIKTDSVDIGPRVGAITVAGLPFSAANWTAGTLSYSQGWAANNPTGISKMPSNAVCLLYYRSGAASVSIELPINSISTNANSNEISFSIAYRIS